MNSEVEREFQGHIDHIVSVFDGFMNTVAPEIIGSIHNLRFISTRENVKKSSDSHMDIKLLEEKYYETGKN
jgi:hypothetical protein